MSRPAFYNTPGSSPQKHGGIQVVFTNTATGHQVTCMAVAWDSRSALTTSPSFATVHAISDTVLTIGDVMLYNPAPDCH